MHIPFVGLAINWGAVGSVIVGVFVLPIVVAISVSLFFWIMSLVARLFGMRGLNKTAEREATSMAIRGIRDSVGSGK